jgi:hypothetical protein
MPASSDVLIVGGGQLGLGLRHGWFLLLVFNGFLAGLSQ